VSQSVLIAGAGIGGLTAALALARRGIAATLFEQAGQLTEAGAGIQLSPNATRVLIALGLAERLTAASVAPVVARLRAARSGRDIAKMPLADMAKRMGTPYWVIHRADLQAVLHDAVLREPLISLIFGARVEDFAIAADGVRAKIRCHDIAAEHIGAALIGADGLWSGLRARFGDTSPPRAAGRIAWRAVAPAANLPSQFTRLEITLWLGAGGHIVHYPIRGGTAVNVVAVARDRWQSSTWTAEATTDEVLARFPASGWANDARTLLSAPARWQKWALYDRPASHDWGRGPVTLLGDAAHPMLPFLAQGATTAIEDAAVLADALARISVQPQAALRAYEAARQARTARVQQSARRNDRLYHFAWPVAAVRNAVLRTLGGERLLAQYDWIYGWRPPA
jgi:salicylate hydroxylase